MASFGALTVGAASATLTGQATNTTGSPNVSVASPSVPSAAISFAGVIPSEIIADDAPQYVADILTFDADLNYQLMVGAGAVSVSGQGSVVFPDCGSLAASRYSVVESGLPWTFPANGGPPKKVAELLLRIPPDANNSCVVGGATVTIEYTAVGPDQG